MPPLDGDHAPRAASNDRKPTEPGITIRNTADIILGTFYFEHRRALLHDDRDFGPMEEHLGLMVA